MPVANVGSRWESGNLVFFDKLTGTAIQTLTTGTSRNTGVIDLNLGYARVVSSNDIPAVASAGGLLAKNTDPILERTNAASDKSLRVSWAAGSVLEVAFPPVVWPASLDATAAVTVNLLAGMKTGSTDAPTFTVSAFEGVGDTDGGGATAALSTTVGIKSVVLTGITGYPGAISISVHPGAHATGSNDVYLYGAWLTYGRL